MSVRFAIAGFGHIGRRHCTITAGYPETEVVAVIDVNPEVQSHELYPSGVPYFSSLEEYLASDVNADVLTVATPNGVHSSMAIEGIKAGHHVVIEKPMGLHKQETEKVVFTGLQHNKNVFVVKQNRYSPPSRWLKEIVDSGKLGKIFMVQINCYWNRDHRYYKPLDLPKVWKGSKELDGGTLFTQFSHFVDIMYWVFGDIKNIRTKVADFTHQDSTEFEDSGCAHFEFENGGIGVLNFSTSVWDTNMESSVTVIAEKGSLKIGGQYMNEIEYCHINDYEMPELEETNPPNDYGPFKGSAANHHYVIENVVAVLKGKDSITANALEGLKVVDIIERIYAAVE